jgi:translocation and assembly module TamB
MRMRRRLAFILLGLLLLGGGALVALPWWFGPALRTVGRRYGVTIGRYERLGYGRFAVHEVRYQRNAVTVTVVRAEADTPVLWWWRHARGEAAAISAGAWSVEVAKHAPAAPSGPTGWVPLRQTLHRVAAELDRWLPSAAIGAGVVRWPGGELRIGAAAWERGTLRATRVEYRAMAADVTAVFAANDEIRLAAQEIGTDTSVAVTSRAENVGGILSVWEQRVAIDAAFPAQGWLPTRAGFQADDVKLPGKRLKIGELYSLVHGHAYVGWQTDHFLADVAVQGDPIAGKAAPPLTVNFRGRGDREAFTIQAIDLVAPGLVAHLSAPVTVDRSWQIRETSARFWIRADLAQQHWVAAGGTATGEADVVSKGMAAPGIDFKFSTEGLAVAGIALQHAEVGGRFEWPRVNLDHVDVVASAGQEVHAHGGWDFRQKKLIDAAASGTLRRDILARWLPPALTFASARFDVKAGGPVSAVTHSGSVDVKDLKWGKLNPAQLHCDWQGEALNVRNFSLEGAIGDAQVAAAGAADGAGVDLTQLRFSHRGAAQLQLTGPAQVRWQPSVSVDAVQLAGPDRAVDVRLQWAAAGKIDVNVRNFPSSWVADFMPLPGPPWTISSLAVSGAWDRAPMRYSAAGGASFALPDGRMAAVNLATHGDETGLRVDAFHGVESGHDVINATARLPLVISPGGRAGLATLEPEGVLALDASTVPNAAFWQQLAAMTGVEMRDPEVRAHLTGTWKQPQGQIGFRATRLAMDPKRFARPLPSVDQFDIALTGDPAGVRLDRFAFAIEGQAVRASGTLPVPQNSWTDLIRDPLTFLRRGGQLRLEIPNAQVAAFSRFLPAALAPVGRVEADVRYDRGALAGFLRLHDAASRPLGPLGVLQQVNADVAFSAHEIELRRVSATAGGEPIELSGRVVLPTTGWLSGPSGEPKYDMSVRGRNLPFVRQAGLLVRGDIDLKLRTPDVGAPRITGQVTLRDSLFLADVRSFVPRGGGASPTRRPPYFSVETAPLDTWVLDVDLVGDRFLRLRTPVFSGVASARFHLGGTLGEPRAIGDAKVNEGEILMPFATFTVSQGAVRLTEDDPYEPTIYVRGTGRRYGYDLTLEMNGKASAPEITFRSSPSLDPEQVTMMVMTGAAPSNEVNTSITHRALQFGAFFGQTLLGSVTGGGAQADRLSISSGEKVSQQGNETYDIEYKLNDRWTLTGEYDEFDEYNVGFKWRVAPKKRPQ